jgi:hypothetical protein
MNQIGSPPTVIARGLKMGYVDLDDEPEHGKYVRRQLKRRGLVPSGDTWEIHGPHQNMNYQVYVGEASRISKPEEEFSEVAVFTHTNRLGLIQDGKTWADKLQWVPITGHEEVLEAWNGFIEDES